MSSRLKKNILLFLLLSLSYCTYWFFFASQWGVAINKEHVWDYGFQEKSNASLNNIKWNPNEFPNKMLEKNRSLNLVFKTTFNLNDYTKIIEGALEYEFRYSAKVLINGVKHSNINRNLITPSVEENKIVISEYWRPRKITLSPAFLKTHLKNGENTIVIIIYNVEGIKWIDLHKKKLSFLSKGKNNDLKTSFEVEKPNVYFSKSTLPIFNINTNAITIPDEPKIEASLNVINNSSNINMLTDSGTFHQIKIELRGNTSQSFAKKSYGFNVYDNTLKKKSTTLLGLPASKKWVLYGPFADKSLIRNALSYSLSNQMGQYAPRTHFIDLVINNNYQGIYILTEKIQLSLNHVNIPALVSDKNDSTSSKGGYLLEIDRSLWKAHYPPKEDTSAIPLSYMIYAPKAKKINPIIKKRIQSQFNVFEKHLYEGNDIYNYLDLGSFIDHLIITEVTKNIDGYRLSTFMYNKNINNEIPKFYLGPIWDYNFSFGLTNYHQGYNPEGYVYNSDKYVPFWWGELLNDSVFNAHLQSRYFELRKTTLSNRNINQTIDSLATICKGSSGLNFKKWPVLNSPDFWPNHFIGKTYNDEINYLKSWSKKRLLFLDNDILAKNGKGVVYYEISIRNNQEWMKEIIIKAKKRNISIDEMIEIDAVHMAKKQ